MYLTCSLRHRPRPLLPDAPSIHTLFSPDAVSHPINLIWHRVCFMTVSHAFWIAAFRSVFDFLSCKVNYCSIFCCGFIFIFHLHVYYVRVLLGEECWLTLYRVSCQVGLHYFSCAVDAMCVYHSLLLSQSAPLTVAQMPEQMGGFPLDFLKQVVSTLINACTCTCTCTPLSRCIQTD